MMIVQAQPDPTTPLEWCISLAPFVAAAIWVLIFVVRNWNLRP